MKPEEHRHLVRRLEIISLKKLGMKANAIVRDFDIGAYGKTRKVILWHLSQLEYQTTAQQRNMPKRSGRN